MRGSWIGSIATSTLVVAGFLGEPLGADLSVPYQPGTDPIGVPGPQNFVISMSGYPRIEEATIDPLDVHVGDRQTNTVWVTDPSGVESVEAAVGHDLGSDSLSLELVDGDATAGRWEAVWEVRYTHSATYHTTFTVTNSKGETKSITMAWTDPCAPPPGGAWALDANCAISGVDGVDNGNFTVTSGFTLTIHAGATFAWNPGKSIMLSGGTIAIHSTGKLVQTNLWMIDADSDGYPLSTTQVAQDAGPVNGRLRRLMLTATTPDVNDDDGTVWQYLPCYMDGDGDGYTVGWALATESGANCPSGFSLSSSGADCYDANADARPGQTGWFAIHRGDGSFDYDCDGSTSSDRPLCVTTFSGNYCVGWSTYPTGTNGWVTSTPACGQSGTWRSCQAICGACQNDDWPGFVPIYSCVGCPEACTNGRKRIREFPNILRSCR